MPVPWFYLLSFCETLKVLLTPAGDFLPYHPTIPHKRGTAPTAAWKVKGPHRHRQDDTNRQGDTSKKMKVIEADVHAVWMLKKAQKRRGMNDFSIMT